MSQKERDRLRILSRVKEGWIKIKKAAELLELSYRQPTISEELKGERPLTQLGRALEKLGVKIVTARSPQARANMEVVFRHLGANG